MPHPRRPVIRFVTSIALGIAYGRRILDLKDEMVTFNRESGLGKWYRDASRTPVDNLNEMIILRVSKASSGRRRFTMTDRICAAE
jgi:hypothetical protein